MNDDLIFDSRNQILIYKGEKFKLSLQLSAILKLFLDAPNYTVADDDLIKNIWGTTHGATIQNFRSATQRLYKIFDKVNLSINFTRVGLDKYILILSHNQ